MVVVAKKVAAEVFARDRRAMKKGTVLA